ncbi:MAG: SRPBCC family protein, partial [Bifidobacterium sp.]
EIRRRTRVAGAFPDGGSALTLIGARIRYVTANGWSTRRRPDMPRLGDTIQEANRKRTRNDNTESAQDSGHYHVRKKTTIMTDNEFTIVIDTNAPVVSSGKILISASPEKVLAILKDISKWQDWRADIEYVKLIEQADNSVRTGTRFEWKANGLKYQSRIHTSSNHSFGWTGKTIGAFAIHNWSVDPDGQRTEVKVSESLSGFAINLMRRKMNRELPDLIKKDLMELKYRCEK